MSTSMEDLRKLLEDRDLWKEQCNEAEKRKTKILLEKLEADDDRKVAEKRLHLVLEKQTESESAQYEKKDLYERELHVLQTENSELKKHITELENNLKAKKKAFEDMQFELQVENKLPVKNVNFKEKEKTEENPSKDELTDISCTCHIAISCPYELQPGQALITFESEQVAKDIINKGKHILKLNGADVEVRAHGINPERTVEFEVNLDISTKKLCVSGLPADIPDQLLKDKLELTFYKSNIGGGEIEAVDYNRNKNSACITYLHNGVAQRVLKRSQHQLAVGCAEHEITVQPVVEQHLHKLQICSGIVKRTVLLRGIKVDQENEDDVEDIIQIHFQKASNGGGEVEAVAFALGKNKVADFEEDLN
ncbi:N-myc-interactor [Pseudophryne corroboree]|uniref:N-myc-interactor n=1 Tax=Pseudophryne corroboree TaxID=495146 RepID=UPI003081660E